MPAFGFILALIGLFLLLRTVRGGLVEQILPKKAG
jgi:hypothetical protein